VNSKEPRFLFEKKKKERGFCFPIVRRGKKKKKGPEKLEN